MQVHTTLTAKTKAGQPVAIWKTADNGEINLCQEQTVRMFNLPVPNYYND